jgi:signal transduction histidine kinase
VQLSVEFLIFIRFNCTVLAHNPFHSIGLISLVFLITACVARNGREEITSQGQVLSWADSAFVRRTFLQADVFMNNDYYDSAQFCLNDIYEKVNVRQPSCFSYYLTSRQTEVYYYNNLDQLGILSAKKGLKTAASLKDPYLLADAQNLYGLFLTNRGELNKAIVYFRKGIACHRQGKRNGHFLPLSELHHLYGNLSEAYGKINRRDEALYCARLSLSAARRLKNQRGIASALLNVGSYVLADGSIDSAANYFLLAGKQAMQSNDFDIELTSHGFLAKCAALKNDRQQALLSLQTGLSLMERYRQLNSFYALGFLDHAIGIYRKLGEFESLARMLEMKSRIQKATQERNNRQYETIMMTGLRNEQHIAALEVQEARQERSLATTRLYLLLLVFVLLAAGFIAYRYFTRQKLKLATVRNKISQDLHDEIGSTLSGIALYGYITREQSKNGQVEEVDRSLAIIGKNATDMVRKLNDIVWVVNPRYDSFGNLLLRLEEYAVETAAPCGISVIMERDAAADRLKLSMDERKNTYLICKEAVNNALKYSDCTEIRIVAQVGVGRLTLKVQDNGCGFDRNSDRKNGNGIHNMASRAAAINAQCTLESSPGKGTKMELVCKITH